MNMATKTKSGVIYILTNPSFPEYIKIGYASNIERRLRELNRSETIPFAFRVYAIYEVDSKLTDKELHRLIDTLNPDLRTIETFDGKERVKEFYAMTPEDGYALLECIAKISGTQGKLKRMKPEGHEVLDIELAREVQEATRRGRFRFSLCDINPGERISFIKDPSITAVVVDDRHVEYDGETISLSALAKRLKGVKRELQGPLYFSYKGETLDALRRKKEGTAQE